MKSGRESGVYSPERAASKLGATQPFPPSTDTAWRLWPASRK